MFQTTNPITHHRHAPCMEYLPTFAPKNHPNVGKYTIHGSYGHYNFSCSVMFPLSAHRIDGPGNRWPQARAPKCLVGRKKTWTRELGASRGKRGGSRKNGWLKQQNPQKMVMSSTKIVILSMLNPILIHLNPPKMVMSSFVYCFTTKMVQYRRTNNDNGNPEKMVMSSCFTVSPQTWCIYQQWQWVFIEMMTSPTSPREMLAA